jgi:hypothetical protein
LGFNGDLYPSAGASVVMTTSGDMVKYQSGARARLGIGSANQILQVKSSLPSWETVDLADTVLTTAGDVLYENATPELARLAKGTQYNNLQMGSALPAWASSSTSILSASGDILYASGANTLAKLAKATDGDTLQLASGVPAWVTVAGGATTTYTMEQLTSDFTTSSATHVDITGLSITLGSSGKFIVQGNGGIYNSGSAGTAPIWRILHDGTVIREMGQGSPAPSSSMMYTSGVGGTCDSTILKMQINDPTGLETTTVRSASNYQTALWVMEIA